MFKRKIRKKEKKKTETITDLEQIYGDDKDRHDNERCS